MLFDSLLLSPTPPPGRLTSMPTSFANTAVMMKNTKRFITKSSIGARSIPEWLPSAPDTRRVFISELEVVREQLGLAARAVVEVVDRVQADDAHREAGECADHRVRDAAGHRARVRGAAQRHRLEHLEHAGDRADQAEQRRQRHQ